MHINRISNTQFKGAYFIAGDGEKVKEAEIKIGNNLQGKGKIDRLGHGFLTYDLPAYLLVTTGKDVQRYNEFVKTRFQECYDDATKQLPPKKTEKDFETRHEFLEYRAVRKGVHTIAAIMGNCEFENDPYVLDVNDVLSSIEEGEFDYMSGETA